VQNAFHRLADDAVASARGDEVLLLSYRGEDSDFVRFNQARIRQAGSVHQGRLALHLIRGKRHAGASFTVSGDHDADL